MRFSSAKRRRKLNSVSAAEGEADFDLLEADAHEEVKELDLLFDVHRDWQRLIAIGGDRRCTRWELW